MRLLAACLFVGTALGGAVPLEHLETIERLHPNGTIASREFYLRTWRPPSGGPGLKAGHHLAWWPNGQLRRSANYRLDTFHGEYRTWRENGQPYELRHFDRGRESGLQRSWNDDGTLFLSYEVRDGRRYGFLNSEPCLPADAEGRSMKVREP